MSDNIIDLLSDDEDAKPDQAPDPVQAGAQNSQNSNSVPSAQVTARFSIAVPPSNTTGEQRRCQSLGPPSASTKHVLIRKRCQSEPHSSTCTMGASTVQTNPPASHSSASKNDTRSTRRTTFRACKDCRKQKMRCEGIPGQSCQRCMRVGRPCVFDYPSLGRQSEYNYGSNLGNNSRSATTPATNLHARPQMPAKAVHLAVTSNRPNMNAKSGQKRKFDDNPCTANKRQKAASPPSKVLVAPSRPVVAQHPAPSTCNTVLWSTPPYPGPDRNIVVFTDQRIEAAPSIPSTTNLRPIISPPTPSTVPTTSVTSLPTSKSTTSPGRPRRTMWTCTQLASLASELQASFDFEAFATRNNKSKAQVLECFSYLVTKPTLEYSAEGQKIARRFHRDMKEDRNRNDKVMRGWRRKENKEKLVKESENAEEVNVEAKGRKKEEEKGKGDGKQKEKGVLGMALGTAVGMGEKVEATEEALIETASAEEREGGQKDMAKAVLDPALGANVGEGEKGEVMKIGPIETTLAKVRDGDQAEKSVPETAFGVGESEKAEVRKRGPIETALALEREKCK